MNNEELNYPCKHEDIIFGTCQKCHKDLIGVEEKFKLSFIFPYPGNSKTSSLDDLFISYDAKRILRACYDEDEGVTYP